MSLGSQVKKYRLHLKWSQEKLAELSGAEIGTISALEVRESQTSRKLQDLAKAFGLTIEQLLDESTDWSRLVETRNADVLRNQPPIPAPVDPVPLPAAGPGRVVTHIAAASRAAYWPFSITAKEFRQTLSEDDIRCADAYIRGLFDARRASQRKSDQPG